MNASTLWQLAALIAVLAIVSWGIALWTTRSREPEVRRPTNFERRHPGAKVVYSGTVPARSARGNRRRDLEAMLRLEGRPVTGRQVVRLRKSLRTIAKAA